MLTPIARARPMRSPRLPSKLPPIAAPSIKRRREPGEPLAAERLRCTRRPADSARPDSDATGIRPSSMPSNTRPRNAAASTALRAACESSTVGVDGDDGSDAAMRIIDSAASFCCSIFRD